MISFVTLTNFLELLLIFLTIKSSQITTIIINIPLSFYFFLLVIHDKNSLLFSSTIFVLQFKSHIHSINKQSYVANISSFPDNFFLHIICPRSKLKENKMNNNNICFLLLHQHHTQFRQHHVSCTHMSS